MDFVEHKLESLSEIQYRFFFTHIEYRKYLIVKFIGSYGYGCNGNGDGDFMAAIVSAGIVAYSPLMVVLDFSELSYEWGDNIGRSLDKALIAYVHPVIVASNLNRVGLTSYLIAEMGEDNPEEWLFSSLEDAIEGAENLFRFVHRAWDCVRYPERYGPKLFEKIRCKWDDVEKKDSHYRFRRKVMYFLSLPHSLSSANVLLIRDCFLEEFQYLKLSNTLWYKIPFSFGTIGQMLLAKGGIEYVEDFLDGFLANEATLNHYYGLQNLPIEQIKRFQAYVDEKLNNLTDPSLFPRYKKAKMFFDGKLGKGRS